jgi:HD-like signal output (HDOD) protein
MVSDPVLEAVLRSGVNLPAPSQSMMRLQAAARDERTGPRELAAIAVKDPVLIGALTRIANSAVFYQQRPARSLIDVIARLGGTKTLAIAVSASLRSRVEGVDPRIVDAIWERSVHIAAHALHAARRSPQPGLADLAYFAALVHDAGICVMLRRYPDQARPMVNPTAGIDTAALAFDIASGAGHAAVGCIVARNWKLPAVVVEAIRLHHLPESAAAADAETRALAALIAVGRRVVDGPSAEWLLWEPLVAQHLGLDGPMIEAMEVPRKRASR